MLSWFKRNRIPLLRFTYMIPILFAVIVSVNHVIGWYSIGNPDLWAIFLSVGVEVAGLSTLVALIFAPKKGLYLVAPFIIVTLIQFIGNIYYSYSFMGNGQSLLMWKNFITTIFPNLSDINTIKFWLAVLEGSSAPLLSLLSLNIIVKFEEKNKEDIENDKQTKIENSIKEKEEKEEEDTKKLLKKLNK